MDTPCNVELCMRIWYFGLGDTIDCPARCNAVFAASVEVFAGFGYVESLDSAGIGR